MSHRSARLRIPVLAVVSLVMAATLLPVQAAAAAPSNVVLNWNAAAAAALFNAPTAVPPGAGQATPVAVIHMAMVQTAVFDAVNSIEGGYEPYLDVPYANPGASVDAAVATAAKRVLKRVIPLVAPLTDPAIRDAILARIQTQFETELAAIPAGSAKRRGPASGPGGRNRDARGPDGRWAVPEHPVHVHRGHRSRGMASHERS